MWTSEQEAYTLVPPGAALSGLERSHILTESQVRMDVDADGPGSPPRL